jgi:hypothetical protein
MKRRKRSSFFLSAAARAASITQNTIAPFMERAKKTVTRKPTFEPDKSAWQQQQRMPLDEMKAQDEQDMFDAQMAERVSQYSQRNRKTEEGRA